MCLLAVEKTFSSRMEPGPLDLRIREPLDHGRRRRSCRLGRLRPGGQGSSSSKARPVFYQGRETSPCRFVGYRSSCSIRNALSGGVPLGVLLGPLAGRRCRRLHRLRCLRPWLQVAWRVPGGNRRSGGVFTEAGLEISTLASSCPGCI